MSFVKRLSMDKGGFLAAPTLDMELPPVRPARPSSDNLRFTAKAFTAGFVAAVTYLADGSPLIRSGDNIDQALRWWYANPNQYKVSGGFTVYVECGSLGQVTQSQMNLSAKANRFCIGGQTIPCQRWPKAIPDNTVQLERWESPNAPADGASLYNSRLVTSWRRSSSGPATAYKMPSTPVLPSVTIGGVRAPTLDPNVHRRVPGWKEYQPPVIDPLGDPDAEAPYFRFEAELRPDGKFGKPRNPGKVTGSRIPRPDEDESKYKSRRRRISLKVLKALDTVSEWAELVDAMYQALPRDVRRKWEAKRLGAHWVRDFKTGKLKWWVPPSIPGHIGARVLNVDQFGQYGIEGAHWKVQALANNWQAMDAKAAVDNIARNLVEDSIHGGIHRVLPKGSGMALNPALGQFGKDLNSYLDSLSIWDPLGKVGK